MVKGIHSSREFSSVLNRERDRTDRTGQEFALVVFEVGKENRKSPLAKHLVSLLEGRVRSTDDIGQLEDGRIAVVLPHTNPDGAGKFVENVRKELDESPSPLACTVYVYPSRWISQDGAGTDEAARNRKTNPSQPGSGSFEMKYSRAGPQNRERPIEELESQFLCGVPVWKRAIDVAGSVIALILLSPLLVLVALFIRAVSPGPVLFRQERVGYLGRVFTIWKFRTMHADADTTVHQKYLRELIHTEKEMTKLDKREDRRIIPLGNLLRATAIDELPQLLNVLRGEMSLVGPRPCLPYEAREYDPWQMRRFDTVPGLTGLWQVSGKNRTTFKEMIRLDIGYAKRRAFLLDMKIFLKTIPAIVVQVMERPSFVKARARWKAIVFRTAR